MPDEVQIGEIGDDAAERWEAFVAASPSSTLYHRYGLRRILDEEFGNETHYLAAIGEEGGLQGVLPLARLRSALFGDFIVSLPYFNYGGPLAVSPAVAERLLVEAGELAGRLGCRHAEFREVEPRDASWPVRTDKVVMRLPLAADHDAQWRALGTKLRAQVKRPEREGATTVIGDAGLVPDFYRVFARNMRDLGTPVYARSFFERMARWLGGDADILVTYVAGRPVAAGFLVHHAGVTEIPWASSLRDWNRAGVNMQLYWEAIRRAITRGSRIFDFGRSTRDSGTYRFKAQWGAGPLQLHWHYWLREGMEVPRLNPQNPRFALAVRAWQRLPLACANLLGPRIVRFLP